MRAGKCTIYKSADAPHNSTFIYKKIQKVFPLSPFQLRTA